MLSLLWKKVGLPVCAGLLLAQLVPYGRAHENPPVSKEPPWDSPRTRELARRACFDCHSHETRYPWYTFVAPTSWLSQMHVDDGRRALDFSAWDRPQKHADEASDAVLEGSMPLGGYALMHGEAQLSDAEKQALAEGLTRSLLKPGADAVKAR